jgi:hypothetical protein
VVEILGKVNEDLSVQLFTAIDFGTNIGLSGVNETDYRFQYCGCVGGYFASE